MWRESIVSRMYDFYNYYNDDWSVRSLYMTSKEKSWFWFIKKNLHELEQVEDKVLYCFENGYYPPRTPREREGND